MKKYTKAKIGILIIIMMIFALPTIVFADVGSFESYDSDWGGSSDWSSSSWGDSSSWSSSDWGTSSSWDYDGDFVGTLNLVGFIWRKRWMVCCCYSNYKFCNLECL